MSPKKIQPKSKRKRRRCRTPRPTCRCHRSGPAPRRACTRRTRRGSIRGRSRWAPSSTAPARRRPCSPDICPARPGWRPSRCRRCRTGPVGPSPLLRHHYWFYHQRSRRTPPGWRTRRGTSGRRRSCSPNRRTSAPRGGSSTRPGCTRPGTGCSPPAGWRWRRPCSHCEGGVPR